MPIAVREYASVAEMQAEARRQKTVIFTPPKPKAIRALIRGDAPSAHVSAFYRWSSRPCFRVGLWQFNSHIHAWHVFKMAEAGLTARQQPPISALILIVLRVSKLTKTRLQSERRHKIEVKARHLVFWLAHRFTSLSLPQIGQIVGGYDHSTVIHARDRVARVITSLGVAPDDPSDPNAWAEALWAVDWPGKRS